MVRVAPYTSKVFEKSHKHRTHNITKARKLSSNGYAKIPDEAMRMIDTATLNYKKGKVSKPIDLSFLDV